MVRWIGGSAISKTRYWVKEKLAEGEPALRSYVQGIRTQYLQMRDDGEELAEIIACGKYAAAAYEKAFGKECPK
jgi:hypothetical protein